MDLLEHPLEAVAFRLYSLPIQEAAAAWTCLAAVLAAAAAAGLWRMRSSTNAAAVAVSAKPLELLDPSRAVEVSSTSQRSSPQPAAVSATSSSSTAAAAASPKERYTAYYRDAGCCVGCCDDLGSDEDEEDGDCDVAEEHEDRDVFVSDGADPFGWEAVVRSPLLRPLNLSPAAVSDMGKMRRYRRSPTATVLSGGGSVVQLWDQGGAGGLTPTSSPRRRGRGVVVGAVSAF